MLHRRLARDYQALPTRSQAMIHVAMIDLMASRCTRRINPNLARHLNPDQTELTGSNAL